MNETGKDAGNFIGYEYKEATVPNQQAALYMDAYENFGWKNDERFPEAGNKPTVSLHLRRNRKIVNRMELTRLQRNFEGSMHEIELLEKSRTSMPCAAALAVGLAGTVFITGAVFSAVAAPPRILLCILLAIPGFTGWVLPYFLFKKLVRKRNDIVNPLIEQKYDEISELCRKGSNLL